MTPFPSPRPISRRLSDYGWAWPRNGHDQLLRAAVLSDRDAALTSARAWLDAHDIDGVTLREHRLLAAVAARFGRAVGDGGAYPRLIGLQRHLWASSQALLRESRPMVEALAAAMPIMLIKGAGRHAAEGGASKGRFVQDIDVLVRPRDMTRARSMLMARGWTAAGRTSDGGPGPRAINFLNGRGGDIDLHQFAYHRVNHSEVDEEALWHRASRVSFGGIELLVPSPADRAALAVGHGSLDAHIHSDWLVDCAAAIGSPDFRWTDFSDAIERRNLSVAAAIALTYLATRLDVDVPERVQRRVVDIADRQTRIARIEVLLQAKPRQDLNVFANLLRGLAKLRRRRRR